MTRIDIPQSGIVKSIGVRFFSFGAYLFLSTPINSLTHSIVELESILKKDASELSERIFSTDIKTAIRIIEQFLLKKLISHDHKIDQVKSATDLLYKHNGNYLIETLADQVNASPRTLERKFEITTGLSPKSFARIIRFNKIRNALTLNPDIDLTSLAFEYNHFDQAHFIKDFKSFAGITPSEFIKAVKAGRAAFNKK